jgi:hypothetical protein
MSHTNEGLYPTDHSLRLGRVDPWHASTEDWDPCARLTLSRPLPMYHGTPPQSGPVESSQIVQPNHVPSLVVTRCKVRSYVDGVSTVNPR